jgi:hypothetical protein
MIEAAVAYLGVYLGNKLLDKVSDDIGDAFESKLAQLYGWVKAKLTNRPTGEVSLSLLEDAPDGEKQQALVAGQLSEAVAGDEAGARELQALVAELDRLRPVGLTIKGLARAGNLHGEQVGADVEGALPEGSTVSGEAIATTVQEGGRNIGAQYRSRP